VRCGGLRIVPDRQHGLRWCDVVAEGFQKSLERGHLEWPNQRRPAAKTGEKKMNKLHFNSASVVFAIVAFWGCSEIHAQEVRAEQAARKADAPEAAQASKNQLLGTWKLQSLAYEVIATGARSTPFGEHPNGYLSYSPDGRMYLILVMEDRSKPRDLVPTDEEKVQLEGSMVAYAGTYTADGEKVVHHVDISWNESWTGTDQVRFYKVDGDTLTITTAPGRSPFTGEERRAVLVWKKVK
jgi:hypothetical protein